MAALLAGLVFLSLAPQSAIAETVTELIGAWDQPVPATVANTEAVKATWHLNLNDGAAAPGNEDVENVAATFTAVNAKFQKIPESCLVDGVDPVSSISADGRTLTCNFGTQKQGTALRLSMAIAAEGKAGDEVSLSGEFNGERVDLDPIPIVNPFGLDMVWENSTVNSLSDGTGRVFRFQWTLFHNRGAVAGPNSITYTINVDSNVAGAWTGDGVCQAFSESGVTGHPWSGGSHPADRTAPSVDTCTIARTATNAADGTATFTLTLTGIDYSQLNVPIYDSRGNRLPTSTAAVASGEIVLRQETTAIAGTVDLVSSAPAYPAVDGSTASDNPANNGAVTTWTGGTYYGAWQPSYTGSSASFWGAEYATAIGSTVQQRTSFTYTNDPAAATRRTGGLCQILDTRYVTFVSSRSYLSPSNDLLKDVTTETVSYYVGSDPLLDPASGSYDPNAWRGCNGSDGWTTTLPSDLSTIKAVKTVYSLTDQIRATRPFLDVNAQIKSTTIGQDVWMWSAVARGTTDPALADGDWLYDNRGLTGGPSSGNGVMTPSLRYPFTGQMRDVLRVVATQPRIAKIAVPTSVLPGGTTQYTLTYSAEGDAVATPTVNGYKIVDTLPAGTTYVAGSASPEPGISTSGGRQVLTWVRDGLPVNQQQTLTYSVTLPASAQPGAAYTNSAQASVDGLSATARATVWILDSGLTRVSKTSDKALIPNPDGTGTGNAAWTVTVSSADPKTQTFTDTIDILPYNGDGRGTDFAGSYTVTGVTAAAGATVYYTTADPSTLSADPNDASNGTSGSISGNTVGWSTTPSANATAIRVIGGALAPLATQSFTVDYATSGMDSSDVLVNTAQARADQTELIMRTSASVAVATYYSASLKKFVLASVDSDPAQEASWLDANDAAGYPNYQVGDEVRYRVCVTNTGQGQLKNVVVTDDLQPALGGFTVATLDPGDEECHQYSVVYDADSPGTVVNTASVEADKPGDDPLDPGGSVVIPDDPAGIRLVNQGVVAAKSSDPADGESVAPGQKVRYTITFENAGATEAVIDYTDHLAGVLDDATLDVDSFEPSGTIAGAWDAGTQQIRVTGYLSVDETATFSYEVTVNDEVTAGATLLNLVTPSGEEPPEGCEPDDPLCTEHPVPVPPEPGFEIAKTADPVSGSQVEAGDVITYTVTGENTGNTVLDPVLLSDDLADVLDDATFVEGSLESDTGDAPVLKGTTWSWTGKLGVGEKVTITYRVTVNDDVEAGAVLNNIASGSGTPIIPDPEDPDEPGDPGEPITPPDQETEHPVNPTPPGTPPPDEGLPRTGADIAGYLALAALMALTGYGIVRGTRRREI